MIIKTEWSLPTRRIYPSKDHLHILDSPNLKHFLAWDEKLSFVKTSRNILQIKVTLHILFSANPLDLAKTINVLQMANLEAGHVASNAPKSGVHHHIVWLRHSGAQSKDIFYGKKEVFFEPQ